MSFLGLYPYQCTTYLNVGLVPMRRTSPCTAQLRAFASGLAVMSVLGSEKVDFMAGECHVWRDSVRFPCKRSVLFRCGLAKACAIWSIEIQFSMPALSVEMVCACPLSSRKHPRLRGDNLLSVPEARRKAPRALVAVSCGRFTNTKLCGLNGGF